MLELYSISGPYRQQPRRGFCYHVGKDYSPPFESLPATSEDLLAPSETLPRASGALSVASEALAATSEILSAASESHQTSLLSLKDFLSLN